MDYHHHARLTVLGREHLAKGVVEGRLSLREAESKDLPFRLSRQGVLSLSGDNSSFPGTHPSQPHREGWDINR
jgi:hypothetical protein